jgi:hypothetical protein
MKKIATKPYQPLAWTATFVLLCAAMLISQYPNQMYGVYGFAIASTLWTIVGFLWQEKSLIFLNGILTIIYAYGIIKDIVSITT